jgi:hypothetical protein
MTGMTCRGRANRPRRSASWCAALLLLVSVPGSAGGVEPVTVALDLRGINEAGWWRIDGVTLESHAITRLLQEGFAVVPPEAPAAIRIRAHLEGNWLALELLGGQLAERRLVLLGPSAAELHLEVSQKIVDLARAASRALKVGPDGARAPSPPLSSPLPASVEHAPARELSSPACWGATAIASMLYRPGGLDVLGMAEVWRQSGRTALLLAVGVGPMSQAGLQVIEAQVQLGVRRVFRLGDGWESSAGVLAGALLHRFSLSGVSGQPQGTRLDWVATAPLTLEHRLLGPLQLGARVAPGYASRGRRHLAGSEQLWQRGAFRVESGVFLSLAP